SITTMLRFVLIFVVLVTTQMVSEVESVSSFTLTREDLLPITGFSSYRSNCSFYIGVEFFSC
ncbi:hypothetical protein BgiBS90_022313, partial [Biomphalaria glabrata]